MNKSGRLLYILSLLRNNKSLDARKLAKMCGVTERTIYRDLTTLSEANIPIFYHKGYKLASETFLPPLNFSIDAYLMLRSALMASPLMENHPNRKTAEILLSKLNAVINGNIPLNLKSGDILSYLNPSSSDKFSRAAARIFAELENAAINDFQVDLQYENLQGKLTKRRVDPYFVVFRNHGYYLVGFCHLRRDYRTFRVSRIRDLKTTGNVFRRDRNVQAESYFSQSWEFARGKPVEFEVEFKGTAARLMKTNQYHESQKIKKMPGGKIRYTARASGLDEIARWLVRYGEEARVISPKELRDIVKKLAGGILKRYRR